VGKHTVAVAPQVQAGSNDLQPYWRSAAHGGGDCAIVMGTMSYSDCKLLLDTTILLWVEVMAEGAELGTRR